MCRSIKRLNHLAPPATDEEIREAAMQYVRKVAGTRSPSRVNTAPFDAAVASVEQATRVLVDALVSPAPPRSREQLAATGTRATHRPPA